MSDTVITNYITAVTVDGDQVAVEISPTGPPGQGVPAGGTTGQVLAKKSGADYDTEWVDNPAPPVDSVNGQTGDVVLGAGDVGAIPASEKGAANGVATLGADGVVPYGQQDMTPWPSRTNNADSWYGPRFVTGTSNITLASGAVWSSPVEVPVDMVIDRLSLYVNTGGAGSSVEIALYTYSPNASDPITLIASAGLADTSTLGAKEVVFGTPVNVAKGIYRIAVMWNGSGSAPILRSFLGNNSLGSTSANTYHFANTMHALRTGQTFPLQAVIDRTDYVNQMPTVAYRGTPQ